jgi:hypothetical protein
LIPNKDVINLPAAPSQIIISAVFGLFGKYSIQVVAAKTDTANKA